MATQRTVAAPPERAAEQSSTSEAPVQVVNGQAQQNTDAPKAKGRKFDVRAMYGPATFQHSKRTEPFKNDDAKTVTADLFVVIFALLSGQILELTCRERIDKDGQSTVYLAWPSRGKFGQFPIFSQPFDAPVLAAFEAWQVEILMAGLAWLEANPRIAATAEGDQKPQEGAVHGRLVRKAATVPAPATQPAS